MNRASQLKEYISNCRSKKFAAGQFDCALFVGEWVHKVTGNDYTLGLKGKYETLRQGRELISRLGFTSHINIAEKTLSEIPVAQANIGDIGVVSEVSFGIVSGEWLHVLNTDGVALIPMTKVQRVFKV